MEWFASLAGGADARSDERAFGSGERRRVRESIVHGLGQRSRRPERSAKGEDEGDGARKWSHVRDPRIEVEVLPVGKR
jgi:hypothetical protein